MPQVRLRNRYRILRRLGEGAMGSVFEARDELLGDVPIALKCLWPDDEADARGLRLVDTLRAEFRILATLHHPLLCRVYDFGGIPAGSAIEGAADDGRAGYFLSRELVAGRDLSSASDRSIREICRLFAAAAAGLDVLHRAGLRHGDFKPANAIVCEDRVRLIDFGLTASECSTERGGTLAYAAPELLRGAAVDRRADLYALGIALFEVLAGELPSGQRSSSELLSWHIRGERPDLRSQRQDASAELCTLISKLIDREPTRRLPTAAEAEAALFRIAGTAANGTHRRRPKAEFVLEPLDRGIADAAELVVAARCGARGGPAVVEIVGAPGSGRTAVLTELSWRCALREIEVVRGDARHRGGALASIEPALRQLNAITGSVLPTAQPAELTAALATIQTPVAIVVDDIDAADHGSRALLTAIAGSLPADAPIAIVIVVADDDARTPTEPPSRSTRALDTAFTQRFFCPPLTVGDIETLTTRALGRADAELARRLAEHTGGNLLHVVSALRSLYASDHQATALAQLQLPKRLIDSAEQELARLPERARDVVHALAVIGKCSAAAIAAVVEGEPKEVRAELESAFPVVAHSLDGDYAIHRTSVAASLTAALEPAEAKQIHSRAADFYEHQASKEKLVRHYVGAAQSKRVAEEIEAALHALLAAGDRVGALDLGIEALELLVADNFPTTALRVELGEIARLAGDIERCAQLLTPLVEGADTDRQDQQRAALSLARALDAGGDPLRAEELFIVASEGAGSLGSKAVREHAYSLVRRGKGGEALSLIEGFEKDDAHLAVAAAYARGLVGVADNAVDTLEQMAAVARANDDMALAASALHFSGLAAYRAGDWRKTRELYEGALSSAQRIGDTIRAGTLRMNLAAMDQSEGAWASAIERGAQAVSLLRSVGARTYALMARRNHAQLLLEIGATEQARQELEAARFDASALGLPVHEIGIDALLGIHAARSGDIESGRAALEYAEERFRSLGDDRRAAETLLDLCEVELDLAANVGSAARALETADDEDSVHNHPGRRARFLVNRALVAALRGDGDEADHWLRQFQRAEAELASQRGEPLRADLHRRAARAAEVAGFADRAQRHRKRALSIFTRIGDALLPEQRLAFWQDPRRNELRSDQQLASTERVGFSKRSSIPAIDTERIFQLLAIYSQLSAEESPDALLAAAMEQAALLVGASRGFLLLMKDGELVMVANRNLPSSQLNSIRKHESRPTALVPTDLPYSRTVAEEVFRTGSPIIGDVRQDSRFAAAASVHALSAPSVLCVPACAGGNVVGALYLESNTTGLSLGPSDARLLAAFGDQVAVLLREAEFKRQLKLRADELERARTEVEALLAERTKLLENRTEELSIAVRENSKLSRALLRDGGAFGLVGASPAMERLYELIERVAAADVPVLIIGESGTGKELVARAIHARSERASKTMVAINCGALPQTLLESELFGHVRGAFTGATRDRRGLFEAANGSTLFLDEVSETPPRMQAALLRAIQEGVVRPVGGVETSVDVRVVCASNRDLRELAARGEFREDLLYRLEVVTIEVPPLRDRRHDIPLLCEHFLTSLRERTRRPELSISSEALRHLLEHQWPGNVRQLEHALTSAAVMAQTEVIGVAEFKPLVVATPVGAESRGENERAQILAALESCGWNRSRAARQLGMPRRTFYRRLAKYGIQ